MPVAVRCSRVRPTVTSARRRTKRLFGVRRWTGVRRFGSAVWPDRSASRKYGTSVGSPSAASASRMAVRSLHELSMYPAPSCSVFHARSGSRLCVVSTNGTPSSFFARNPDVDPGPRTPPAGTPWSSARPFSRCDPVRDSHGPVPSRTRAHRRRDGPKIASYGVGTTAAKSLASCRSGSWLDGSPNTRLTMRPRFTAGRAAIASVQRCTCA